MSSDENIGEASIAYEPSAPLKNPKHEHMIQLMVNHDLTQDQALKEAGFKPHKSSASRIVNSTDFQQRLQLLRTRKAEKAAFSCAVTTESLIAECEEARLMAERLNNPQAVIAAIKEKGVLSGKRIERSEQGEPGEFEGLNEQELAEYIGQKMAELGIEIVAADDQLDPNDGTRH